MHNCPNEPRTISSPNTLICAIIGSTRWRASKDSKRRSKRTHRPAPLYRAGGYRGEIRAGADLLAPTFKTAFAFLRRNDLAELPEGWVELEHGVRASVQHYTTVPARELKFETHERFFDIQFIVKGEEWLGCVSCASLSVETPYNAANDVTFYKTPQVSGGVYLRARSCGFCAGRRTSAALHRP